MVACCSGTKIPLITFFVLKVWAGSRFQNYNQQYCKPREKENKFYAQLMKKWELLHLTLNDPKSDKG